MNQDVIQVDNNKCIKIFSQDFINITLEAGQSV